jgi:acetoin utilization deacetylase AcuC-like enzyme/GNAT superfamily N-acetyltransferase
MLRIRRIYDDVLPVNKQILAQVKDILRSRFTAVKEAEIELIGEKLRNPFKHRFRTLLFVAETLRGKVQGFAMVLLEPEIGFVFLDWIAITRGNAGGGLGDALYDRVRQEALALNAQGIFFECLPDDAQDCPHKTLLKENRARLRFYERYGARPIINTGYETPLNSDDSCMPYLVYDGLETQKPLRKAFVKKVVRAILERKYADVCPPEYVESVVTSIKDDPVKLRDYRYVKPESARTDIGKRSLEQIAMIVNDKHAIHHVHERGYVESPVRVSTILGELEKTGIFVRLKADSFPEKHIYSVHDKDFVNYLRRASADVPERKSLYPYIFPIRNKARPPRELSVLAGYYCIDTFTPIHKNAYLAARQGVECTLTAAREILNGRRIAYALVRPPGHHAERRAFGGFCYFNNNAIAAQYLCAYGKVAILDIDYHHGNGQQDIFLNRPDVLTISIHGHPSFAYPYFSGFAEEHGEGDGEGFNLNLPLPENVDGERFRKALTGAISRIEQFSPQFLVVALGLDTAKGDPTGTWSLTLRDFEKNGRLIGAMGLPTIVVQEGGYRNRTLGKNVRAFFKGLAEAHPEWTKNRRAFPSRIHGITLRHEVEENDRERIRRLIDITGFFSPSEVNVAVELVEERLAKGLESGYHFIIAEHYGRFIGYCCYGPIPCTISSYDLYWIAIHPDFQGRGMGQKLMKETERLIKAAGGFRLYAETSKRIQYSSTRAFYENCGYHLEAVLENFYGPGEGKAIYCKTLETVFSK